MENRPPQQETPRRPPNSVRKTNGSGGPPTPPWLWLIVIGLLALIFWHFVPKTEVEVPYYPWFTEAGQQGQYQVGVDPGQRDPRRTLPGRGLQPAVAARPSGVKRFYTYVPSELMIQSVVEWIKQKASHPDRAAATQKEATTTPVSTADAKKKAEGGLKIVGSPPNQANGLAGWSWSCSRASSCWA